MSNQIYSRHQLANADSSTNRPGKRWSMGWLIVLVISLGLSVAGAHLLNKRLDEKKMAAQKARAEALSRAPSEIETAFRKWSDISAEKDVVVKWIGAESEILYLRYTPEYGRPGYIESDEWELWARSKSGKIFTVRYWLNEHLEVVAIRGHRQSTSEALLRVLMIDGKTDLIEKLKYQVRPA